MDVTYHGVPKRPTTSTKGNDTGRGDKGMANDSKPKPKPKPAKKN